MKNYSRIAGIGSYLPKQVVTNKDLESKVETTHEWILERTGIERRHILESHETSGTMAEAAAKEAIASANISPKDIDMIIVATTTPDKILPSVACLLQEKLKTGHCPAFDLVAACTGFIYGLSIADQYIKTGAFKNILLVATESMSRITDWTDRRTCVLFGDGAGAVVLQPSTTPGVLSTHIHASGYEKDLLWVPSALPTQNSGVEPYVQMKGKELFRVAVNYLSEAVDEVLDAHQITGSEIDWLIPHQANYRIIQAIAKKLNMPMEKVVLTVQDHGNTSAASVPLAMHEAIKDGRIQRGHKLLLDAFGAGLTWGSAYLIY